MHETWLKARERAVPVGDGKVMRTDLLRTRFHYRVVEVRAVCRQDGFSTALQLVPTHVCRLWSEYDSARSDLPFSVAEVLKRKGKEVVPLLVSTLYSALLIADG